MTERSNEVPSSGSPEKTGVVLKIIEDAILTGRIPKDLELYIDGATREKLKGILENIVRTQKFALSLAEGDLSQDLALSGTLAGSLKNLQSNLRHLTWQAKQIASGDFSQRVNYLGEFSNSFNTMVEHLSEDRTNRIQREEELQKLNAALTHANEKISILSSITRHDIRNQLQVLRGYLDLSMMKTTDPELLSFMEKEEKAADAIGHQIEFTKYYEDIGVNAPEWQDVPLMIQSARSQLPLPDTIMFVNDVPPMKVFADALIGKVFYNLIENTLRHGEHVSRIRFSLDETEQGARIVYEDNGVGISLEDKAYLFQKGFGKNTGLGLFLSREILAITGLSFHEEGEPGKGVRFIITIPRGTYRISQDDQ